MKQLNPSEQRARAARLRRIVRNGEELVKLLATMKQDLYAEYIDTVEGTERWQQRRDDYWSDLTRNFGKLQEILPWNVRSAQAALKQLGEPEKFTRKAPAPEAAPKPENAGPALFDRFTPESVSRDDDDGLADICNL